MTEIINHLRQYQEDIAKAILANVFGKQGLSGSQNDERLWGQLQATRWRRKPANDTHK